MYEENDAFGLRYHRLLLDLTSKCVLMGDAFGWGDPMKKLFSVLASVAIACGVTLAQTAPDNATPQSAPQNAHSSQDRATSHDRHMHKHRSSSRHHRHHTSKSNPH